MVDLRPILARDSVAAQRLPYFPGESGQILDVFQRNLHRMAVHQEKPVAAPRHVAHHLPAAGYVYRNLFPESIARNIADRDLSGLMQLRGDDAYGGLDAVPSRRDPAEVSESSHQPYRPMPAHAE